MVNQFSTKPEVFLVSHMFGNHAIKNFMIDRGEKVFNIQFEVKQWQTRLSFKASHPLREVKNRME